MTSYLIGAKIEKAKVPQTLQGKKKENSYRK